VVVARRVPQILQNGARSHIGDLGKQSIVERDILYLAGDCAFTCGGESRGDRAFADPAVFGDWNAKPFHLPLNCPGMASLGLNDIDEGPHFTEPFDDGRIGCLGLSLVVESFDQNGL
jgi:hypothetical protein